MPGNMELAYYGAGGLVFTSVLKVFAALIAIWMIFVIGSAIYEYGTGKTREFPLAFTMIRVGVVLSIAGVMSSWFTA